MRKGIVIKSTGSWLVVRGGDNRNIRCRIKGNFRIKGIRSTNPVTVGDHVEYIITNSDAAAKGQETGMITAIDDRKNYIVRRSQNLSKQSHVIAANIDQVFLLITQSHPVTTTTFIDRFLASAEAYRIPAILVFNKADLLDDNQLKQSGVLVKLYETIGYKCLITSAVTGEGLTELKQAMEGKISLFGGHSGVGKTTLINLIQPGLKLKTREISELHKTGKHTTSFTEMYELNFGGYVIDTPGIKAFGMLDMQSWEISHYFPEIFRLSADCQYNNCTHTHEPGCAVKTAVEKGAIAQSRFISYLGLLEADEKYRPAY